MKSKDKLDNFFEDQIEDEIEVTHKTTFNPKEIRAMKNFQALCNEVANKILEQAAMDPTSDGHLLWILVKNS